MGCGCKYNSASAVIKHIEDNGCAVLMLPEKTRDGPSRNLPGAALLTMGRDSPGPQYPPSEASSEDQDTDGGVPLDFSTPRMEGKLPARDIDDASFSRDDWPELDTPATPVKGKEGSHSPESAGGVYLDDDVFSTSMRYDSPSPSPRGATNQPSEAGPSGSTLAAQEAGPSRHAASTRCRATAHLKIRGVNPEKFWNQEKSRYYCNCGASFLYVATFEYHLTMEDETISE